MPAPSRHLGHDKYKTRIENLFKSYSEQEDISPESLAHNAKYLAVLVSGYLEQAVKELFLQFASQGSRPQVTRYIEETWPISRNMDTDAIKKILLQFNTVWAEKFDRWLSEHEHRKADINLIVSWRNRIAHGQEANTTGVTLVSVKNRFNTIKSLVDFLQTLLIST